MATKYPVGYGTQLLTMEQLKARYSPSMHPEYARRLFNWIEAQGGRIGIGGGRRAGGQQPNKPGFAPEGKSFHQDQRFASNLVAYSAVDLVHVRPGNVHRSPYWSEVPAQGSSDATRWGVHCNVGRAPSGEPWHMQAVPQDGFDSWVRAGRPDPTAGYPIPGASPPAPPPPPTPPPPAPDPPPPAKPSPGGKMSDHFTFKTGRKLDTRTTGKKVAAGETVRVVIQKGAIGASVTLTAVSPSGAGFLTVSAGGPTPNVSTLNFVPDHNTANTTPAELDADGALFVYANTETHLLVDLVGIYS